MSRLETSIEEINQAKKSNPSVVVGKLTRSLRGVRIVLEDLMNEYQGKYPEHRRHTLRSNCLLEASSYEESKKQKTSKGYDSSANGSGAKAPERS